MTTVTPVPTVVPTGTWAIDPKHSTAGFAVKHMGIATVRGEFTDFEGTLEIGDDISKAEVHGTVKVASVDTSEESRDGHLRSPDFFDADTYPEMTFASTSIEAIDDEPSRSRVTSPSTESPRRSSCTPRSRAPTSTRSATRGWASRSRASSRAPTTG
jgi:polyisoprenoid-binding protein YceI